MFYIEFISASRKHIKWLQKKLEERIGVVGHISGNDKTSVLQLRYAKREALEIIGKMYYTRRVVCLSRKREKIEKALAIEKKQQKLYS
jgi:phosphoribosyl-AMP cyclohydrolase